MTEEEALQRLRAQDTAVLHWLIGQYNRYVASIIRAVLGKTCREEDAEELTADVFYSVFRRAGSISPESCRHILARRPRNRAKDFLRKQKPLEADLDELTLPDGEGTAPEAELLRRERQMRVKEAIFSMEPVDPGKFSCAITTICSPHPRLRRRCALPPVRCAPDSRAAGRRSKNDFHRRNYYASKTDRPSGRFGIRPGAFAASRGEAAHPARAPSGSFCKGLESHAAASAPQEERCWPRSLPHC